MSRLTDGSSPTRTTSKDYDRDLIEIFAIQSEVALTVANKLMATFSPEEKDRIQEHPTNNLEAYDLYLRAKELMLNVNASHFGYSTKPLSEVTRLLEQAVRLDWRFTLAYCTFTAANAQLYAGYDPSPARRATGEAAMKRALGLEPDLPEVHLAYAYHLCYTYHDYELAKKHLAIAERGLPSNVEAFLLDGWISRRQGYWEKCIQQFKKAITLDPRNPIPLAELGDTFYIIRRFREAERAFNHAIDLAPDPKVIKLRKAVLVIFQETADDTAAHQAFSELPVNIAADRGGLSFLLSFALFDRDWQKAEDLIERLDDSEDDGRFAYGQRPVPVRCHSILLARFRGEEANASQDFAETREKLNRRVQKLQDAPLLSQLAVVDALLGHREDAISEAKRAVELLPVSKDALSGPLLVLNLAVVYAWTNESDMAIRTLEPSIKIPASIYYGQLKRDPLWDPLRKDSRFEKFLAELAPKE
jgi:tetratricopeptide (TPR) repeat protein